MGKKNNVFFWWGRVGEPIEKIHSQQINMTPAVFFFLGGAEVNL